MTAVPPLTVIEASAGTGKTFSLVTRLMTLVFSGVEPERIVALTFSRKAAGEIFNSFIERLSRAASSDAAAAAESGVLALGRDVGRGDFSAMLRKVVSRQHLMLVGTLDSFLVRMVRAAAAELGFEDDLQIMGEYRDPVERVRLAGEMMSRASDGAKSIFRKAFELVNGSPASRTFVSAYAAFIQDWHSVFLEYPELESWGGISRIWGDTPPAHLDATVESIRDLAVRFPSEGKWGLKFADALARYSGGTPPRIYKGFTAREAAAAAIAASHVGGYLSNREISKTAGAYLLMRAYDAAYTRRMRETGLVSFSDLPRLVNSLPDPSRLDLEYRMDARFDHWALDEFQDTSREQWKAIGGIIAESRSGREEKSVFIVGDRKQSIYDWRGGDVRILSEEADKARNPPNRLVPLNESRRYPSAVSNAVNRVFGEGFVEREMDFDGADERMRWRFSDHASHDKSTQGFVQVLQAAEAAKGENGLAGFLVHIENALNAVKPWEKGISTAILVRKRDTGLEILSYLKSRGIDRVAFEGDSPVMGAPALDAMASLARLAENAGDAFSYARIGHSPLSAAMWPDGLPAAAELSADLLRRFSERGLSRVFRDAREALKSVPDTWNEYTESRFEDFLKCAAEFEDMRTASMRLSDFADFAAHKMRRDFAGPGAVRIMTVHQSKGLGFDWCIVPVCEPKPLVDLTKIKILSGESPRWLLSRPATAVCEGDKVLSSAFRAAKCSAAYDELCVWYVAMTRCKKALTLILNPPDGGKDGAGEPAGKFSELVRRSGLETEGDPGWHLAIPARTAAADSAALPPHPPRARRAPLSKHRPGELFRSGMPGDALFSPEFGAAAAKGVEAHAGYEAVEWLDAGPDATPFERALSKPSPDATLWRETPYEIFADGKWESGRFDRVVFTGSGDGRRATIYDFKTNALRPGETEEAFAARLAATYSGQMQSYRNALSRLASIPVENIGAVLLASATSSAIPLA